MIVASEERAKDLGLEIIAELKSWAFWGNNPAHMGLSPIYATDLALKRAGHQPQPSGKPHMTMLYDERIINQHAVETVRWTASEFVLVLSHLGKTQHELLARWPLTRTR